MIRMQRRKTSGLGSRWKGTDGVLAAFGKLYQRLTGLEQGECVFECQREETAECDVGGVSTCHPDDLGWRSMSLDQFTEVGILREDDGTGCSCLAEDLSVRGVAKTKGADRNGLDAILRFKPGAQAGRKLCVEPDLHAATMG